MNGETHRRVRSAGQRAFTPRRLTELELAVERITEELLDELAGAGDLRLHGVRDPACPCW